MPLLPLKGVIRMTKRAIQHEKYNGKEAGIYILNNESGELIWCVAVNQQKCQYP